MAADEHGGHVTIHISDEGVLKGLGSQLRTPIPTATSGLRRADVMGCSPLRTASRLPRPQLGRIGVVAFWDSADAADRYLAAHPCVGGWSARLTPIRAVPVAGGHYPGVPTDLGAPSGATAAEAPVVVLTIAHTKLTRLIPFLRASAAAEANVEGAPGFQWSTALVNPPRRVVATVSLWATGQAAHDYATGPGGHREAMQADATKSFHHAGSFVRFRVDQASGTLAGRNPYPG